MIYPKLKTDRVLVQVIKTDSVLYLPALPDNSGLVIATGSEVNEVCKGDRVQFEKNAGVAWRDFRIMTEEQIFFYHNDQ